MKLKLVKKMRLLKTKMERRVNSNTKKLDREEHLQRMKMIKNKNNNQMKKKIIF